VVGDTHLARKTDAYDTKVGLRSGEFISSSFKKINAQYKRQAEKPTEKTFRASYRATFNGAVIHDASYFQYFEMIGGLEDMEKVLNRVIDPFAASPLGKRYVEGFFMGW
jgi:hypothetical protein